MPGHTVSTIKQHKRIVDTLIIEEMKKVQQLYSIQGTKLSWLSIPSPVLFVKDLNWIKMRSHGQVPNYRSNSLLPFTRSKQRTESFLSV